MAFQRATPVQDDAARPRDPAVMISRRHLSPILVSARSRARAAALGLAFLSAASFAGDPAAVLQAARAATGGAAWDAVRTLHIHARLQSSDRTGVSDRYEDVRTGRFVREYGLPPRGGADGFDGQAVWTQPASGVAYVLGDEDARLGAVDDGFRVARGWWFPERRPAAIEDAGMRTEDARSFDLVRMTPEGGRPFVLWVDRATHLPDRAVEQAAEQTTVTRWADYRWVDGVRLAFSLRSGDGDPKYDEVETVERIDVNADIADRRFSIPPLPAAATRAGDAVSVPFRLEDNRILLQVAVNGHGPYDAQFDSGGSLIVPPAVVADLRLTEVGKGKETGGGEGFVTTSHGALDSLSIGGAVVSGPAFHSFAWDDQRPDRLLIGLETLQQFVVQFDFDRMTMTLTPPGGFRDAGAGAILPFHFQDNQPEIFGSVDGIAATMAVDTGDNGSLLLIAPFARKYGLARRYHATIPYAGSSVGVTGGLWARAGQVTLNGADGRPLLHVDKPVTRISTQQSGFDANRYVSANLGMGVLKQFNLTFDYARQRIILEPNHLYGVPDVFSRSGLRLDADGAGWKVVQVFAGGAGERAGVREGDRIAAIDGRTRPQLDRSELRAKFLAPVGTHVELQVVRDGGESTMTLTLADVL